MRIPGYPRICGCYYTQEVDNRLERTYLPQVKLDAHTTVFSTASRTVLKQTFVNQSKDKPLGEIRYAFPLFDGVSVVGFKCEVDDRTIYGLVKEKAEARKTYEEAKARGEKAALLEQLPDMSDIFTTSVSSIPEGSSVVIMVTYVQELKHDAEVDGVRLTMPTHIAPRYSSYPGSSVNASAVNDSGGVSITVDINMAEGVPIKKIISPSHPVEVSLGSLSTSTIDEDSSISKASASLALCTTELEKDFVLQIVAKDIGIPQAILETHPTLPAQRALMTTLVPKFNLKSAKPEIIFIADRSGSMSGNIPTLISALQVFLKSIPVGCMFNICSFGSNYEFLWDKSKLYGQDTLTEAFKYVNMFGADFGGTETLKAVKAAVDIRHKDMPTELMLLTDGDITAQQQMFDYLNEQTKSGDIRVFPIGIGGGVSSALIEGVARAGKGFAQMVGNNEKLDGKMVRMLKGALTPHIKDYQLEVKYEDDTVDSVAESLRLKLNLEAFEEKNKKKEEGRYPLRDKPIPLYDPDVKEEHPKDNEDEDDMWANLPQLQRPKLLQAPQEISALFPFNRTSVYLLMSPAASDLKPKAVVLKGTSRQGPLELEIPIEIRKSPDEMIHQLAARKATQELEEGRGWICGITTETGTLVKDKYPAQYEMIQKREAVRLGVEFQVGGKHCSFVAVEANEAEIKEQRKKALESSIDKSKSAAAEDEGSDEWEMVDEERYGSTPGSASKSKSSKPQQSVKREELDDVSNSAAGSKFRFAHMAHLSLQADCRYVDRSGPSNDRNADITKGQSTGGKAPRAQLASKAARKSAPSGPAPRAQLASKACRKAAPSTAGRTSSRSGGKGLGMGGALRHRRIAPESSSPPGKKQKRTALLSGDSGADVLDLDLDVGDEEEAEESDCDMGFGLFDGDSPPATPAVTAQNSSASVVAASYVGPDKKPEVEEGTVLQRLTKRQSFEGSWSNDDLPCDAMNIQRHPASVVIEKLVVAYPETDRETIGRAFATAIAVTFLEQKLAEHEDTWELMVEKAKDWLDEAVSAKMLVEMWKEAQALVGKT